MRDGERGLALVSVLWCLALLSLIAAAMLSSSLLSARASRNAWTRLQADMALDAGVHRAIAALLQPNEGWPTDGSARTFVFGGVAIQLTVQDQAGLIDLNTASQGQLQALFVRAGNAPDQAAVMVDRILDWRSPAGPQRLNGAVDYGGTGYLPRNGPFQSVDELRLVLGMTGSLFTSVEPLVTVYGHQPGINTRAAPQAVLESMLGIDSAKAAAMVTMREQQKMPLVMPGSIFSISASISQGSRNYARNAVVQITGDPENPFWILSWK